MQWCLEIESEDTWVPMSHCTNSQLINQTQEWGQTVLTCSVQWVCHAFNKWSYVMCPQRTSTFIGLQNYLAFACCMKPGCSSSLCPHTDLSEIHPFSITQYLLSYWYHAYEFSFPLMCCKLCAIGLFAEISQVKFCKDRVEMQIWSKPAIFFHEPCLQRRHNGQFWASSMIFRPAALSRDPHGIG